MSAKKSKLEKQFRSEAQIEGVRKNIFNGTSIFVNGYTGKLSKLGCSLLTLKKFIF